MATGLRYSEIASILPESFDWKAPSVTVAAAYTKNGRPGDAAPAERPGGRPGRLRGPAARWDADLPVAARQGSRTCSELDLEAAGIPYRGRLGVVLRLPFAPLPDGDAGRCRWRFASGRSTPHAAFDP